MSEAKPQCAETKGLQVALVLRALRSASTGDSRFALHLMAHDTHDEYRFAVSNPDLVTIIPAWQGD